MIAGLPGLALAGLYFTVCALAAPLVELARALGGQRRRRQWRQAWEQFALAVAMLGAYAGTGAVVASGRALLGSGESRAKELTRLTPVDGTGVPGRLLLTGGLLVAVLMLVRLAGRLAARRR